MCKTLVANTFHLRCEHMACTPVRRVEENGNAETLPNIQSAHIEQSSGVESGEAQKYRPTLAFGRHLDAPLSARESAEQQRTVGLLTAKVEQLSAALVGKEREARGLAHQVTVKQNAIENLTVQLEKQARLNAKIVSRQRIREQAISSLEALGDEASIWVAGPQFRSETDACRAVAVQLQHWELHWAHLQGTMAWRLTMVLRRARKRYAPPGSKREQIWLVFTSPLQTKT